MLGIRGDRCGPGRSATGSRSPERSPGGHRLYSRDQVDQLRFVKAQLAQGHGSRRRPSPARRAGGRRVVASLGGREAAETRLLILLAERDPHAAGLSEYFLRTEGYEVAAALDAAGGRPASPRS